MNKFLVMLAKKPVELSCMTCCVVMLSKYVWCNANILAATNTAIFMITWKPKLFYQDKLC